jgi:transcription-repair coupling factor (superfamily II helicase)
LRHPGLFEFIKNEDQFKDIISKTDIYPSLGIYGADRGQKHFIMSALGFFTRSPLLVITSKEEKARAVLQDMSVFFPPNRVDYFPVREIVPMETYAQSREVVSQRVEIMDKILHGKAKCVVTTVEALSRMLPAPQDFKKLYVTLKKGQEISREDLIGRLIRVGYERVEVVEIPGQMAVRGGIMDVFGITASQPVRIEFFGDEIDTFRIFNPNTQRSLESIDGVTLLPAVEFSLAPGEPGWAEGKALIEKEWTLAFKDLDESRVQTVGQNLRDKYDQVLKEMESGIVSYHLEQYLPYFVKGKYTLLNYYRREPFIIVDEPLHVREEAESREEELKEVFRELLEQGKILPRQEEILVEYDLIREEAADRKKAGFSLLPGGSRDFTAVAPVSVSGRDLPQFQGKFSMFVAQVKDWQRQKYSVIIMTSSKDRGLRLKEGLWDNKIEAVVLPEILSAPVEGQVVITYGKLFSGFEFPAAKLVLVSDSELFGRSKLRRPRKQYDQGLRISDFSEIKPGDYVVHVQHGIGKYLGVINLEVQGVRKDYLHIQYFGQDKVYVPTDNVNLISKYVGAEGHKPKLHRLGTGEWVKTKKKVRESVKELAKDLLNLYAARETIEGFAFNRDTPWQAEFEEAFPFNETKDQVKAITEVKSDMEKSRPMDRLLVGDVGYGKTEVAMRGAFKAVMDNKQVAVLVPTTVLAQQHLRTFKDRFRGVPAKIEVLSRLKTPGEQKKIIAALEQGKVDIIIGTHRLLSKDVRFKDLGLLIIDEEQRFGVAHKERLKQLRQNIDVLTLTATPIPRTLHMALAGARDMSIINTPPENRYPVQTYVVEYSKELVVEAIRRELDRGGQVFYVYNLVSGLERRVSRLQKHLPQARIAIAHGQMPEKQLDKVMVEFIEGEIDILVCTTIIENGLDIGNVNTLIVENADRFGLSQLYQLRGRVGRSNRIAYAYFTYDKRKVLGETAEKRLNAIREFTEFGSGFKLAMRDLEIRGAGNLLGAEQHGHMLDVGFDLYCQLLEDAVRLLKGEPRKEAPEQQDVEIELNISAYVPDSYIEEPALKLDVYHQFRDIDNEDELKEFEIELEDRFGQIPREVQNLFLIVQMRLLARRVGINSIKEFRQEVRISFDKETGVKGNILMTLAKDFPRQLSFSSVGGLLIKLSKGNLSGSELGKRIIEILCRFEELAGAGDYLI